MPVIVLCYVSFFRNKICLNQPVKIPISVQRRPYILRPPKLVQSDQHRAFKGEAVIARVLGGRDLNFCVRSTPPRTKKKKKCALTPRVYEERLFWLLLVGALSPVNHRGQRRADEERRRRTRICYNPSCVQKKKKGGGEDKRYNASCVQGKEKKKI